jgi:hypothetical protein
VGGRSAAVVIEEVKPGSNAERAGVQVGDEVAQCSAIVLKTGKEGEYEKEGYGQRPYENWEKTMLDCTGVGFDTVMGAIRSNNSRWGYTSVDLVLSRKTQTA